MEDASRGGRHPAGHRNSSAEVLAQLHIHSWGKEDLRRQFDTRDNFRALRIEPYLLTTGRRNPDLDAQFREEAHEPFRRR